MKRNGFVFVETIIAVVVLSTSLLLLYSSFSKVLQSEKTRINYDDTSYIYRSYYLKNTIKDLNYKAVLNYLLSNNSIYFVTIGTEHEDLIKGYEAEKEFLSKLVTAYDVSQMIILKENKIDDLKKCSSTCLDDESCSSQCQKFYNSLSSEFINYVRTIFVDVSCEYILAVEYNTCNATNGNENCRKYYSWVSV